MQADVQANLEASSKNIIGKLKQMENNPNWTANGTDPCPIFKIQVDDRIASKGVATVNYSIEKVIQFLNQPNSLSKINEMLLKFEVLHTATNNEYRVVYMEYKGIWPVSNRDFVCLSVRHQEQGKYYIATQSVKYPHPEVNGIVRAQLHIGGYILQRVNENTTVVTYISDSDVKGNIPGMIKNSLSSKQGAIASKIGPVMQKEGF